MRHSQQLGRARLKLERVIGAGRLNLRDRPELGCGEVNALVDAHIAQVRTKMKELRALERELMDLRRSCDSARTSRECGILNSLAEPA